MHGPNENPDSKAKTDNTSPPLLMREMRSSYGFLFRAFFERFFSPIQLSPSQENQLQSLARKGHIVYVMESASVLHFLFMNFWCLKLQLPLATYGNGIPVFSFFQPLGKIFRFTFRKLQALFGIRKEPLREPFDRFFERSFTERRGLVLFLRHSRLFRKKAHIEPREMIESLLQVQSRFPDPIFLAPLGILWGRRPEKVQKSVLDILLGRKESPGFMRQLLMLTRYSRQSVATMGQVFNIREFQRENAHVEHELLVKKIWWALHRELSLAKKQIAGPNLKPRKHIVQSILSSMTLREMAREIARSEGKTFDQVMKQAAKYADEIAADYNSTYVAFLEWLFTWVWNNIYSGLMVDKEGIEKVKKASRKGSLILLPSHKSHIDYLVLSYVFYHNDLPLPHIAAGVNLSFWPLGHIFRKAGAFFIRRTFQGQRLYSAVFSTYIKRLLREGYVQEFFPEGTRSRTGKLLFPKLGMLSMEVEAFSEGVSEDLFLVPISISYEKVVEESSYSKESEGVKKEKEKFRDLLKTPKFLKKKYGRVYIQFAQPLSLREYLQSKKLDLARMGSKGRRRVVEDLALRTCFSINEVTTVTPSALAALVLLNHPKRGITQPDLFKQASFYFQLLQDIKARISLSLQNLPWALEEALDVFVADKVLQRWDDPEGTIFTFEEDKRVPLNYYKNNILHYFLPFSLSASVFRMHPDDRIPESTFLEGLEFFMKIFQREFIFPPVDPTHVIRETVYTQFGVKRGCLSTDEQGMITVRDASTLDSMATLFANFYESYYIVLHATEQILQEGEYEEKEFFKKLMDSADRLYRRGDLRRIEAKSIFVFRNAIASLSLLGLIQRTTGKAGTRLRINPEGVGKMRQYRERFSRLLFPLREEEGIPSEKAPRDSEDPTSPDASEIR